MTVELNEKEVQMIVSLLRAFSCDVGNTPFDRVSANHTVEKLLLSMYMEKK